ncbi:MAG TPA: phosphoribosylamine--glycine ligase, partial [Streptosporangiaceae bacterium]
MRVLLLGSGGREHALARALARDSDVAELHAAPGNPGIARHAELHQVSLTDPAAVTALARQIAADLVVVGPEAPLMAGVGDALREAGFSCFGPDRAAAMIEGSKSVAKQIMLASGIPTAAARTCQSEAEVGQALDEFGAPYVVKADGLAAGKGVVVTNDRRAAAEHARACGRVVIEEFLAGPEVSVFALADGLRAVPLLPAQDFKRAREGDTGPNTGGMGAYSPSPLLTPALERTVMNEVVRPLLATLAGDGIRYRGVLYAGLMVHGGRAKVLEFNVRFGDPECQMLMLRLRSDLLDLALAVTDGTLGRHLPQWDTQASAGIVLAAKGYPNEPAKGDPIT